MEKEVFRAFGGALTIADAISYVEAIESADEIEREINESISIFDGVCENILSDQSIKNKKVALKDILRELKALLEQDTEEKMKSVFVGENLDVGGAITLKSAAKALARKYPRYRFIPLNLVIRAIIREIRNSGSRNQAQMINDLLTERDQYLASVKREKSNDPTKKAAGYQAPKEGSTRYYAMVNSGLDPTTGRPFVIEKSKAELDREFVEDQVEKVMQAIKETAPRVVTSKSKVSKLKQMARVYSGLSPDGKTILF